MTTIDNRIIRMTFDNGKFERDVAQSIKTLDSLKSAMDFKKVQRDFADLSNLGKVKMTVDTSQFGQKIAEATGQVKSLQNSLDFGASSRSFGQLGEQVKGVNLAGMGTNVAGLSKKFLALATIGITALAQIASKVASVGIDMATAFSTDPIIGGFREMETNMNSIQTILANTASKGTDLQDVNNALNILNEYSDKTIYNFSQMAKAIGQFTAAGVELDQSVGAIKGIANLAAISGSSADQANTAMGQLSQALAAGKVRLIDWMSVRNAGMGGEVFKTALFETGKALGTLKDVDIATTFQEWTKAGNSFEASLEQDWLTSEVLTTALQSFTGDLNAAQLQTLGYTEDQAIEMEKLGKLGVAAATEVKTLTQLLGTVKESMGSGWSRSFQIIFGDFEEAKAMFTDFNNIVGKFVGINADARNDLLKGWKDLGGRTRLIDGLKSTFEVLRLSMGAVKEAFHDLFPAVTSERLFELTDKFAAFMEHLRQSDTFFLRLNLVAKAVFSALDIGIEIVKEIGEMFGDLFKHFSGGDGEKMFDLIERVALGIINWHDKLIEGDFALLPQFFEDLTDRIINFGDALKVDPSGTIKKLAGSIGEIIGQLFKSLLFGDFVGGPLAEDSPIVAFVFKIRDFIKAGIESITDIFEGFQEFINGVLGTNINVKVPQGIKDFFDNIGENTSNNTSNSLSGGFDRVKSIVDKIGDGLDRVKSVADQIKAVADGIADAFGWAWDKIKMIADKVGDAFGAVWDFAKNIGPTLQDAFMSDEFDRFLDLMDSLGILLGGRGLQQFGANNANLGANLGANFGANFGGKGVEALTKGGGIIDALKVNLSTLTETLKTMQTQIRANALLDIAKALAILTASVLVLSFINPESLAKSLTALAVGMAQLLGAVALLNVSSGKGGLTPGLGLLSITVAMNAIATAILILSGALAVLAQFSPEELAHGLLAIETLIVEMATVAVLLKGASANLIAGGIGMIAIATALVILAGAMKILATLSWEEIGKGLAAIAGGLLIIAGAMYLMSPSVLLIGPGLVAVAFALNLMASAMIIFATMSWEEIGKGLTALGGGLLLIAAAMNLMPLSSVLTGPALIATATAITILAGALKIFATMSWEEIGKAMTVLGGSLLILAGGLHLMSGTLLGAVALGVAAGSLLLLGKALKGFADMRWKDLGKGLAIMAISLGALALAALAIQPAIPAMLGLSIALLALGAGFALIGVGAALLAEAFQIIAAAGTAGIDVLMYALDSLLVRVPELIKVFTDGFLLIIQSIIDSLPAMVEGLGKIIAALLKVIIENLPQAFVVVAKFVQGMLQIIRDASPDFVKTGFKLLMDFLHGIESNITEIVDTVATIIERFLRELTRHVPDLVDAAADLIIAFVEGIASRLPDLITAGVDLLQALLQGVVENIDDIADSVGDLIERFIEEVAKLYGRIAKAGADAFVEFLDGMGENAQDIIKACARLVGDIIDGIVTAALILANRMADALIALLEGLTEAIETHDEEIADAAHGLIIAIVKAMVLAIGADEVVKALWDLGKGLWNGVKKGFMKAAGISSPSQAMYDMAVYIPEGLVLALSRDTSAEKAGEDLANRTIQSFRDSVKAMAYSLENTQEFNPTITPVMDLTQVKATAGQISGLMPTDPISAGVSVDQANAITAAEQARAEAAVELPQEPSVRDIKVEQNNYSPEALNTARIWKQTKSLIEVTKRELENA